VPHEPRNRDHRVAHWATKIETKGFAGASCRDASRFIEEALGQRAGEQLTAEFHQAQTTHHVAQENR
jgi:hypothetical protein